jgi:hypothetical protein
MFTQQISPSEKPRKNWRLISRTWYSPEPQDAVLLWLWTKKYIMPKNNNCLKLLGL